MPGLTFEDGPDVEAEASRLLEETRLSAQESDIIALLDHFDHYDPATIAEALGTTRATVDVALSRIRDKREVAVATVEATERVSPGRRS